MACCVFTGYVLTPDAEAGAGRAQAATVGLAYLRTAEGATADRDKDGNSVSRVLAVHAEEPWCTDDLPGGSFGLVGAARDKMKESKLEPETGML